MARHLGLAVARAPGGEQPQRGRELARGGGGLVDEARRAVLVARGHDERLLLELAQPRGEDVRGDPGDGGLQVAEAFGSVEETLDDEIVPAVADGREGGGER